MREGRVLARNIFGVLNGRAPRPFVYHTLGMMGSLGHNKGFGLILKFRVRGRVAWFVRRSYYLLQMPGWGRRMRIVIDWTFALLFRPDIVKVSLDSEAVAVLREESHSGEDSAAVMPKVDRTKQDEPRHHDAA
jgi:NADH dehydrogenase